MELAMHAAKILTIDMRVDLCCRDIGMPEHLLTGAQVRPPFQQMGRGSVTKPVRSHS